MLQLARSLSGFMFRRVSGAWLADLRILSAFEASLLSTALIDLTKKIEEALLMSQWLPSSP